MKNENLLKETKMSICNSMHIYILLYKWELDISGEIEKLKTVGTGYLKCMGDTEEIVLRDHFLRWC